MAAIGADDLEFFTVASQVAKVTGPIIGLQYHVRVASRLNGGGKVDPDGFPRLEFSRSRRKLPPRRQSLRRLMMVPAGIAT